MIDSHLRENEKIMYADLAKEAITQGRGIYAGWLKRSEGYECIYIGKAGNLHKRIRSHYSGQRGSDQFCLYLFDSYVKVTVDGIGADLSKQLNQLTKQWARDNILFSYVEFTDENISETEEEKKFRKVWQPTLNPL